jgi:hypothetical protein
VTSWSAGKQHITPRWVLDLIITGRVDAVAAELPTDARSDLLSCRIDLVDRIEELLRRACHVFDKEEHHRRISRKAFVAAVTTHPEEVWPLVFAMADGKDTRSIAIKLIRKSLGKESIE